MSSSSGMGLPTKMVKIMKAFKIVLRFRAHAATREAVGDRRVIQRIWSAANWASSETPTYGHRPIPLPTPSRKHRRPADGCAPASARVGMASARYRRGAAMAGPTASCPAQQQWPPLPGWPRRGSPPRWRPGVAPPPWQQPPCARNGTPRTHSNTVECREGVH